MKYLPALLFPVVLASTARSGELTIESKPFFTSQTFSTTALPGAATLIRLDAKAWADYEFTQLAAHGSKVAAGDVLMKFDTEEIDQKLADARRAISASELKLAQAELEFKTLTAVVPLKLEQARRAARNAKEEQEYFVKTRRKAAEEGADQALKRSQENLENAKEELKQLAKMYDADDLTEETEEIILVRQRDAVARAEFGHRMEILDHERALKVTLPREAETLATAKTEATLGPSAAEEELPRKLALQKIELEIAKSSFARDQENLAKLGADRKLFEVNAPTAGWFYHGTIDEGRWTTGEMLKGLVVAGKAPLKRSFATFIPATEKLSLTAFVDEAAARTLAAEQQGRATLSGREDLEVPVKVTTVATTPGTDGRYRVHIDATWPEGVALSPCSTADVALISYDKPAAIAVPTKALTYTPAGWSVDVKLADGKSEHRVVKRGRSAKDSTEILSGLEAGQVVIVP
ncbi:MAG: hypothetical protein RLZZ522_1991 [Verrucomicrobiota bacterium]